MISKRFSIFTILLALLLTFGHNSYSQGVSDDEIILGMHTDISGPVSSFGKYSVEGVQMRIDEINKAGGIHGRMLKIINYFKHSSMNTSCFINFINSHLNTFNGIFSK